LASTIGTCFSAGPSPETATTHGDAAFVLFATPKAARLRVGSNAAVKAAHAVHEAVRLAATMPKDAVVVVNVSGRGDKDVATAAAWFGLGDAAPVGQQ